MTEGPQEKLLTEEDKKRQLYLAQKQLLEAFLARGAISRAQFDKSFGDLTEKMGMQAWAGETDKEKD